MTLTDLTLAQARDGLRARDFSAVELTEAYLSAIAAVNPRLNAYVLVTDEAARAQARAAVSQRPFPERVPEQALEPVFRRPSRRALLLAPWRVPPRVRSSAS